MHLLRSLAIVAFASGVALAQPSRKEAGEHFKKGEAAQAESRFRDAIAEYEQAYALVPHPNALFNIAVCYEKLGEYSLSADYYERYLDEPGSHPDAVSVKDKIRDLRAKTAAPAPVNPPPSPDPVVDRRQPPTTVPSTGITLGTTPAEPPRSRWHAGVSYGIGFGDAPVERYLAYGGVRFFERLELDAILGKFGKNDLAVGATAKLLL